ncbi:MAG: hypothetical protein R6U46_00865 [Marinilabilia sp.]
MVKERPARGNDWHEGTTGTTGTTARLARPHEGTKERLKRWGE